MAFFLARSALCVGAVAMAASGVGPAIRGLHREVRVAAGEAGGACLASATCLRAGAAAAARIGNVARGAPPTRAAGGRSRTPPAPRP